MTVLILLWKPTLFIWNWLFPSELSVFKLLQEFSCCKVAELCPTLQLRGPQQASLSFTVSQSLLKLMSTESVMQSNHLILCHLLLLLPPIFPSIRVFSDKSALCIKCQSIGASALASFLPVNIQGWFPLGLTGLISLQSKGLSRVFSSTTVRKHQFFSESLTDTDL